MSFFKWFMSRSTNRRRTKLTQSLIRPCSIGTIGRGLEPLEDRRLLSVSAPPNVESPAAHFASPQSVVFSPIGEVSSPSGSPGSGEVSPSQIRHAYGFDQLSQNGAGQTIAIIVAYDDPKFVSSTSPNFSASDLHQFDMEFGLPDPPSFTKIAQDGTTNYPAPSPLYPALNAWGTETSMDVEWIHALAPQANILLVEANSPDDLYIAVDEAKNWQGPSGQSVSVVSMSWGSNEFSGEQAYDSHFVTPAGHQGITFLAATGDSGAPGKYPAYSPNVVAVGGTTLTTDANGDYISETTWNDTHPGGVEMATGGGISAYENQPSFQSYVVANSRRTIPDVSFASDESLSGALTGVWVYDSYDESYFGGQPWIGEWGTSFSVLQSSAMIAMADQARVQAGLPTLDGPTEALPRIYRLPTGEFHDITTGNNIIPPPVGPPSGYYAGPGYDFTTGRGTPLANHVVSDFVPHMSPSATKTASPLQVALDGNLSNQDLYVVGSDGFVRQELFQYSGGHTHTGQAILDNLTSFNPGTKITVYDDGQTVNLFAVGADGLARWCQFGPTGWTGFSVLDRSTSFLPGAPLTGEAKSGLFTLYGVASDGHVKQEVYTASTNHWASWSSLNDTITFSTTVTTPLTFYDFGTSLDFWAVMPSGDVGQLFNSGSGWNVGAISASSHGLAAGTPLSIAVFGSVIDMFGVNSSGAVIEVQFASGWNVYQVVTTGSAQFAPGTQLGIYAAPNGLTDLFGVNQNGFIGQVQFNPAGNPAWTAAVVPNSGGFAVGSQVSVYTDPAGVQEVFGLAATGQLFDEEWTASSGWIEWHLG